MDNSIYEVERDDYMGVVRQINPATAIIEKFSEDNYSILKIKNKEGVHFTTLIAAPDEDEIHYYVFTLPQGEDCLPPKAVRKITLETKEEVQHFFNALAQLQKGELHD